MFWRGILTAVMGLDGALLLAADRSLTNERVYRGTCDASAAVAILSEHFAVASDEGASLRVYCRGKEAAEFELSLATFLDFEDGDPEADIEGATWLGDSI